MLVSNVSTHSNNLNRFSSNGKTKHEILNTCYDVNKIFSPVSNRQKFLCLCVCQKDKSCRVNLCLLFFSCVSCLSGSENMRNKRKFRLYLLCVCVQGTGLSEWEEQGYRSGLSASGWSDSLSTGSHPLLQATRGRAGA